MNENVLNQYLRQVKIISESVFKGFEGYDIGKMMADNIELYRVFGIGKFAFFKMFIPYFINDILFPTTHNSNSIISYLSITYSGRKDFLSICRKLECIDERIETIKEKKKYSFNHYFFKDLKMLMNWMKVIKKADLPKECNYFLLKRMEICFKLKRIIEQCRYSDGILGFISQYDAHDTDNLIAQYMKVNHIPTITLQHGQFHSSEYISEESYNLASQHFGFVSDYFFAWGDYSRDEALKDGIQESRIRSIGSLKTEVYENSNSNTSENIFGVILNGRYGFEDNIILMEYSEQLSEEYGIQFIIRPHPGLEQKNFESKNCIGISYQNETITQLAKRCKFVICGNSTIVTEMIAIDEPVFFLRPSKTIDWYGSFNDLKFNNYETLKTWIDMLFYDRDTVFRIIRTYKKYLFATTNANETYHEALKEIIG